MLFTLFCDVPKRTTYRYVKNVVAAVLMCESIMLSILSSSCTLLPDFEVVMNRSRRWDQGKVHVAGWKEFFHIPAPLSTYSFMFCISLQEWLPFQNFTSYFVRYFSDVLP